MDTFSTSDLKRLTAAHQGPWSRSLCPLTPPGLTGNRTRTIEKPARTGRAKPGRPRRACSRSQEAAGAGSQSFLPTRLLGQTQPRTGRVYYRTVCWNHFRVPLSLVETVVVNRRFQVKPLLPLIGVNDQYFVLALSQNRVRFLEGRQFGMQEVKVNGLPKDMAQALNIDFRERPSMAHAAPRGSRENTRPWCHSLGGDREPAKDELTQYFRAVDAALRDSLREQRAPLILAGVQYLLPIYREVSSYAHIAHERSLRQSRPSLGAGTPRPDLAPGPVASGARSAGCGRQVPEAGRYRQNVGRCPPDRVGGEQGQVETLFVDRAATVGAPSTRRLATSPSVRRRRLNQATMTSWITPPCKRCCIAAVVYAVSADQVPSPPAAAILRY